MATGISTYVDFPGYGDFTLRVFLAETYDIIGNYSDVSVTGIGVQSKMYGGKWYPGGTLSVGGTVVGTMDYYAPATHAVHIYSAGETWYEMYHINSGAAFPWAPVKVTHNNDGSKTVEVSVNITLWRSSSDNPFPFKGTQNVKLTTIPRASVVSGNNGTLGTAHTLNLTRYATAFTHTLAASCGDKSMTIKTGVQADTVTWTPPIAWAAQNTTGTSVSAKITCTTYNGSTAVGSTSVTLTFAIPSSVAPTVKISVSDKQGYFSKYGNYVQGKSQAQISATGTGAQGSTISSYSVVSGSTTKSGASPVFDLPTAGTVTFKVTVTDSRGRTGSASVSITVAAYSPPSVVISAAYRCDADGNEDPDGSYAIAVFSASVTSLNSKNSATFALKYRVKGSSTWSSIAISSLSGNYAPSNASQIAPISTNSGYELSVEAADDFGPVLSAYRTIQVAFSLADFDRINKAIGFGQRATTANTAAFGLAAMFNRGVTITPISIASFDVIDSALSGIIEKLDSYSLDFCVFNINGGVWHCILFKTNENYATAEFYSYAGRRRKILNNGTWGSLITIR